MFDPPPSLILDVLTARTWQGGSTQLVVWRTEGTILQVRIQLVPVRQAAAPVALSHGVTNNNSMDVRVPLGLSPGKYFCRVTSFGSGSYIAADGPLIDVDADAVPPAISAVTTSSQSWCGGATQQVTWSSEGAIQQVRLHLVEAGQDASLSRSTILAVHGGATGSCIVTAPVGLPPGRYCVRIVSTADRNVSAASELFSLDAGETPPAITDVATASREWAGGSTQHVSWRSVGAVPEVRICLLKPASTFHRRWLDELGPATIDGLGRRDDRLHTTFASFLAHRVDNVGSCAVQLPSGLRPGT